MLLPGTVPDDLAKPILACLDPDPAARPTPATLAEAFEPLMRALPKPRLGGWKPGLHV
jgi:serine/threonine-protein kinase